ncbi:hypothetical protein ABB02_00857 [Clostridiaceae bacterium JG1575]|nr:hypothetical protein ABB02_00857 [Clostridiaceae bacterium JG1575]
MAKTGDFVRIQCVLLPSCERTGNLPEDTRKEDLLMWTKGFLKEEAALGDCVSVVTAAGREASGRLIEEESVYEITYGGYVPELMTIGGTLRAILRTGKEKDQ